jgi:adenylate kinase family enzyme
LNQTLATLNLTDNTIGNRGAQYLANALEINTVGNIIFYSLYIHYLYLPKTLTLVNILDNRLDYQGKKHLANSLLHVSTRMLLQRNEKESSIFDDDPMDLGLEYVLSDEYLEDDVSE